jgi:hypothetical protein
MLVRELRKRPDSWAEHAPTIRRRWTMPLHAMEWTFDWTAYYLSRWAFLEVLEYLGILSVLVAVAFYFTESGDRIKQKHYQAWQVINTAQGKGGSGGRIDALQELNADRVPLVGVDVSEAFLQGVQLNGADLLRANLDAADIRDCGLRAASLEFASLKSANLRHGDLRKTDLQYANLEESDLTGADLAGADLTGADLTGADLQNTDWKDARWQQIKAITGANIHGIRNAPRDFADWALAHGAVSVRQDDE